MIRRTEPGQAAGRAALPGVDTRKGQLTITAELQRESKVITTSSKLLELIPASPQSEDQDRNSGGNSMRVPPLPIPNREVKPHHADGTTKVGE